MSEQLTKKFIEALGKLEADQDTETIVGLFADNSEIGNVVSPQVYRGAEGAREFWTSYRKTFGEIRSDFRNQIVTNSRAALEWTSTGTSADGDGGGAEIDYEGVSILEMESDKIIRFFAYFNPAKLGREIAEND
jgi:hypothetical protein